MRRDRIRASSWVNLSALILIVAFLSIAWRGGASWLPIWVDRSLAIDIIFPAGVMLVYLLPTWVVCYRRHPSQLAIFALNLLAGWTVVGWLIAIIWSLSGASSPRTIACPHCAEQIQPKAKICRFCGLPVKGASTEVTA